MAFTCCQQLKSSRKQNIDRVLWQHLLLLLSPVQKVFRCHSSIVGRLQSLWAALHQGHNQVVVSWKKQNKKHANKSQHTAHVDGQRRNHSNNKPYTHSLPCPRTLFAAACNAVLPLRSVWRTSAPCRSSSRSTASSPSSQARCSGLLCRFPMEKLTSRSRCFPRYDFSFRTSPFSTYLQTRFWPRDTMRTDHGETNVTPRGQISLCFGFCKLAVNSVRLLNKSGDTTGSDRTFRVQTISTVAARCQCLIHFLVSFNYVTQERYCSRSLLSLKRSRHISCK